MLELEKSLPKGHHLSQQFINMHYGVDYTTREQHTRDSPTRGFSAPVGGVCVMVLGLHGKAKIHATDCGGYAVTTA